MHRAKYFSGISIHQYRSPLPPSLSTGWSSTRRLWNYRGSVEFHCRKSAVMVLVFLSWLGPCRYIPSNFDALQMEEEA